jgi:hypothetical protein
MTTIKKTEFCDKKVAKWIIDNITKIPCRVSTAQEIHQRGLEYCNRILKLKRSEKYLTVKYKKPGSLGQGRYFANIGSIQGLPREIRHTICKNEYYDIDLVNSQPTILSQYCKLNKINCPKLDSYVKNRDKIFEDYKNKYKMTKNDIKMNFVKILNGSKKSTIQDEYFIKLLEEMKNVTEIIRNLEENKELYNYAKNRKDKTYNINGSIMSYRYQIIENEILMIANDFFISKGYDVDVLVFDGCMIRKNKELPNEILDELNHLVKEKMKYEIKFVIKPMDEGYDIPAEELEKYEEEKDEDFKIIENDKECSNIILKSLGNKVVKSNNRYFFKVKNFYTEDLSANEKDTRQYILKIISDHDLRRLTSTGESKHYSKEFKGANNILNLVMSDLNDDSDFTEKMWNSNLYKLCFKNGYWNFKTNKFEKYDDETITPIHIKREFKETTEETKKLVYDKILDPILRNKEQQKIFLNWIARGCAGIYEEKTWSVGLGNRNTGKGVLSELIFNSLESYAGSFNPEELICTRVGNGDIAKKLAWTIPFEYRRINISNELKTEDEKGTRIKLDGNILKSIASGGDKKRARLNYKNEIEFRIQGRCLFLMNEMIDVSPQDACETLTTFKFQTEFKDELTESELKINEEETGYYFALSDPKIKSELLQNPDIQNAFIHILIDHFTNEKMKLPEFMSEQNTDLVDTENRTMSILKDLFIFTDDKSDELTIQEVDEKCKSKKLSKSAYILQLNRMGIFSTRATRKLKTIRFYQKIKFKP